MTTTRNTKQTTQRYPYEPTPWAKSKSINWNRVFTVAILVMVSVDLVLHLSTVWIS